MHARRRPGILFVLSAPSGAGKTSIRQRLLKWMPGLAYSVSYTTRAARSNEREGVDYHFIGAEPFRSMVERGEFVEWAEVHGNCYGTALRALERHVAQGTDVVLDIDVQGADQIQGRYKSGPIVTIFILPPSAEELGSRLRQRASETRAQLERRLQRAPEEILRYKDYDYAVVNRDLDQATRQVAAIIEAERCRTALYPTAGDLLAGA
jgi:guanylate kinase